MCLSCVTIKSAVPSLGNLGNLACVQLSAVSSEIKKHIIIQRNSILSGDHCQGSVHVLSLLDLQLFYLFGNQRTRQASWLLVLYSQSTQIS